MTGNLTCNVFAASVSGYGIQDYYLIGNTDFKLVLDPIQMLKDTMIVINGEKVVNDEQEVNAFDDIFAAINSADEEATTEHLQPLSE